MQRLTDVGVFHPHVCAALRTFSAQPLAVGDVRTVPHPGQPDGPTLIIVQTPHGSDWWVEWTPPVLN